MNLGGQIKKYALEEAGFDAVAFSRAELEPRHGEAIERWIKKGHAGDMTYMVRDGAKRARPQAVMPDAKSVISLVVNYYHPDDAKPEGQAAGKVAKYAYGRDYHKVMEKMLKKLVQFIQQKGGEGTKVRSYVDTGPILEKAFAQQSGLGFFGKNTNIITREFGSFVFLASLITNLELTPDSAHLGACGSCRICIDACPTDALLGNYEMDARRCISYLTIESKQEIPAELKDKMSGWAFGCDICQDVCPYNFRAKTTRHQDLYPLKKAGSWLESETIALIKDEEEFKTSFEGSPVRRAKLQGIRRNLAALQAGS